MLGSLGSELTWHDGLLAVETFGGVLVGVALGAQELLIFGGEGLVHQRALAHEAVEAVLVPVAVLVGQVLWRAKRDIQRERVTLVFSLFGWSLY